jgi:hypothetical protein
MTRLNEPKRSFCFERGASLRNRWIPDKSSDIMLFFVMGTESGEGKMRFKHMCKQEIKKLGNLDLNQGPTGYESVFANK